MSLFKRPLITSEGSVPYRARNGEGFISNIRVATLADAAATLTIAQLAGGAVIGNYTAARVLTTPTAAQIIAACPDMDIGDAFELLISMQAAFAATFAAGAGVTLLGRATVPASANSTIIVTRTGVATVSWMVL